MHSQGEIGEIGSRAPLLHIGRGWAVYVGSVQAGRTHRHQASQLAWSACGILTVEGDWGMTAAPGHLVAAGVSHRLHASEHARILYADAALRGHAARRVHHAALRVLSADQVAGLELELRRWLKTQNCIESAESDPDSTQVRFVAVLEWLERALEGRVRVEEAANAVRLSPSRFMHWFAEMSGLPFRAFVRWLRLQRAIRALADGHTLTRAAHIAGFADSAHFTRTFVQTFGVPPSPLRSARIVCHEDRRPPIDMSHPSCGEVVHP